MVNRISRRQLLKKAALGTTGILATPSLVQAGMWQDLKTIVKREIEKIQRPEDAIKIPYKEPPPYEVGTYRTISIEKGTANIKWRSTMPAKEPQKTKDHYSVLSTLSAAKTSNKNITSLRLEISVEGFEDKLSRNAKDYDHTRIKRNINWQESGIWVAYPRRDSEDRDYIRLIPEEQKFLTIRRKKGRFEDEWKKGISYEEDYKAQLMFKLGEETLDSFLAFAFPKNQKQMKKTLEKIVEWCEETKKYHYREIAKSFNDSFVTSQIKIHHPSIIGTTIEKANLKFGFWNKGENSPLRIFGNLFLGDSSNNSSNNFTIGGAGGYVENWELIEGEPVFSY